MGSNSGNPGLGRPKLEEVLRKRFFYCPSFESYGGVSGLFDYGPPGTALEQNILEVWRKHFVQEENMLEISTSMVTPHEVLETSGHVSKFRDWMCRDPSTGEIFRADHLIREVLTERVERGLGCGDLGEDVFGERAGPYLGETGRYERILSQVGIFLEKRGSDGARLMGLMMGILHG